MTSSKISTSPAFRFSARTVPSGPSPVDGELGVVVPVAVAPPRTDSVSPRGVEATATGGGGVGDVPGAPPGAGLPPAGVPGCVPAGVPGWMAPGWVPPGVVPPGWVPDVPVPPSPPSPAPGGVTHLSASVADVAPAARQHSQSP